MDQVSIRRFEPADERAVRSLSQRLSEGFAPWRDPTKVTAAIGTWIDAALEHENADGHLLMVAARGVDVLGFIGVEVQDHYISGRDAYIGELAVADEAEGRGIGRQLLAAGTEWARAQGCERLTLQTGAANARARTFYEQLGFDYEDVSMAKPLERST